MNADFTTVLYGRSKLRFLIPRSQELGAAAGPVDLTAGDRYIGISFQVRDLETSRKHLVRANQEHLQQDGLLVLPPQHSLGALWTVCE